MRQLQAPPPCVLLINSTVAVEGLRACSRKGACGHAAHARRPAGLRNPRTVELEVLEDEIIKVSWLAGSNFKYAGELISSCVGRHACTCRLPGSHLRLSRASLACLYIHGPWVIIGWTPQTQKSCSRCRSWSAAFGGWCTSCMRRVSQPTT